jgi:hypothetical protein
VINAALSLVKSVSAKNVGDPITQDMKDQADQILPGLDQ